MPLIIRKHIRYPERPKIDAAPTVHFAHRTCRPWSAEEDRIVRRNYRADGSKAVAAQLGRDYRAVQNRARVLGVTESR